MESWREEFYASDYSSEYLAHHGIKGQRWGVRRYQNADGTLTSAGRARYLKQLQKDYSKLETIANKPGGFSSKDLKKASKLQRNIGDNPIVEEAGSESFSRVNQSRETYKKAVNDAASEARKITDNPNSTYEQKQKAYNDFVKKADAAHEAFTQVIAEDVRDYVGWMSGTPVNNLNYNKDKVSEVLTKVLSTKGVAPAYEKAP